MYFVVLAHYLACTLKPTSKFSLHAIALSVAIILLLPNLVNPYCKYCVAVESIMKLTRHTTFAPSSAAPKFGNLPAPQSLANTATHQRFVMYMRVTIIKIITFISQTSHQTKAALHKNPPLSQMSPSSTLETSHTK